MTVQPTPAGGTTPTPISDADVQAFADMSAALTGFLSSVLKPFLDPVGLASQFYIFALSQNASALASLLALYQANRTLPEQQIADLLLETGSTPPSAQALFAQSIVSLWYLGTWYVPGQPGVSLQVVSAQAYTNGLAWKVAQAHAMGFSPYTFGYWSQPPLPLSSFGVGTDSASKGGAA
jgi:hypothetical protein